MTTTRYYIKWSMYPKGPWVLMDAVTDRAVRVASDRGFRHYDTAEQAQRQADKLNRKMS